MFVRYMGAQASAFVAMSAHVYLAAGRGDWLVLPRIGTALSAGALFGQIVGLLALWIAWTLRKSTALRWSMAVLGAWGWSILAWWSHSGLTLYNAAPQWSVLAFGGAGLASAFLLADITRERHLGWQSASFALSIVCIYAPIYLSYAAFLQSNAHMALLYFDPTDAAFIWWIGVPFALCITLGAYLPLALQHFIAWRGYSP